MAPTRSSSHLAHFKATFNRHWTFVRDSVTSKNDLPKDSGTKSKERKSRCSSQSFRTHLPAKQRELKRSTTNLRKISIKRNFSKDNIFEEMKKPETKLSLTNVLQNEHTRNTFRQFLKKEHSEENIDFWEKVEEYRRNASPDFAKKIYETFIENDSLQEVNVSHNIKLWTKQKLEECSNNNIFDRAQADIFSLLQKDSFARFSSSVMKR